MGGFFISGGERGIPCLTLMDIRAGNPRMLALYIEIYINKKTTQKVVFLYLAEREGFEPPEARTSTVFKTAAIDRSAISPRAKVTFQNHVLK